MQQNQPSQMEPHPWAVCEPTDLTPSILHSADEFRDCENKGISNNGLVRDNGGINDLLVNTWAVDSLVDAQCFKECSLNL